MSHLIKCKLLHLPHFYCKKRFAKIRTQILVYWWDCLVVYLLWTNPSKIEWSRIELISHLRVKQGHQGQGWWDTHHERIICLRSFEINLRDFYSLHYYNIYHLIDHLKKSLYSEWLSFWIFLIVLMTLVLSWEFGISDFIKKVLNLARLNIYRAFNNRKIKK